MTTKTLDEYLRKVESVALPLQTVGRLTIAQSIRRSSDPYRAAVASFTWRDVPHGQSKHVYYFEDRSSLTFEVTYTAIEDGTE